MPGREVKERSKRVPSLPLDSPLQELRKQISREDLTWIHDPKDFHMQNTPQFTLRPNYARNSLLITSLLSSFCLGDI